MIQNTEKRRIKERETTHVVYVFFLSKTKIMEVVEQKKS